MEAEGFGARSVTQTGGLFNPHLWRAYCGDKAGSVWTPTGSNVCTVTYTGVVQVRAWDTPSLCSLMGRRNRLGDDE